MYKIGTRGSLLAVTQSTLTKEKLEALSGEKFELVLIKTQGDQITDKPLWQLDGKDFFTKELDLALLSGEVDLVIHSYKDLGSERPKGIKLAAITERHFAHDILLIKNETIEKLKDWSGDFIVGTSSPRRIVNLTSELSSFLPGHPSIKCEMLRGNINTRIQKLRDGNYDAITLALAGIDRLSQFGTSYEELKKLLDGLNFAVLPLSVFPAAASQGALGIEMSAERNDNGKLQKILEHIHHAATAEEVKREREAFKSYGGGCHLAVGIHVREFAGSFLHFHRGETEGKKIKIKKREGVSIENQKAEKVFLGQGEGNKVLTDQLYIKTSNGNKAPTKNKHVFVTTALALPSLQEDFQTLWAAGPETRKKLVAQGHWVNGGADGMGHQEIQKLYSSPAIKLMCKDAPWIVLSHDKARSPVGEVFASYTHQISEPSEEQKSELKLVTHAWWASFPQYEAYITKVPELKNAQHFCGLGKTYLSFKEQKISVTALTDHHEFLSLVRPQ
jgi:hydroxymethylbilane synthase